MLGIYVSRYAFVLDNFHDICEAWIDGIWIYGYIRYLVAGGSFAFKALQMRFPVNMVSI